MSEALSPTGSESTVKQADYLKLFMQELTYQDPLKPVDNKEFMAQMAQFTALQTATQSNELLSSILGMTAANQALSLLGKTVRINDSQELAKVQNVSFEAEKPPKLSLRMKAGSVDIVLNDIKEVLEESYE